MTSTPHHAKLNQTNCNDTYTSADVRSGDPSVFSVGQEVEHVSVNVLSDLVKQVGISIGENIVSCLKCIPASDASVARSTIADLSKVSLTVSHHSYEPHPFRGGRH